MGRTYEYYVGLDIAISFGLAFIIFIGIFLTFYRSKKGKRFVEERIIGIEPAKMNDDDDDDDKDANKDKKKNKEKSSKMEKDPPAIVSFFFCLTAATALSITAVFIFKQCFLANTKVSQNDNCPDYSMNCFPFKLMNDTPATNTTSVYCDSFNKVQFPSNSPNAYAWCFGWVIEQQTTENILNQLGACTGLIGLFTTLLAIIVYFGRREITLTLCTIFVLMCIGVFAVVIALHLSISLLTYAVLALGVEVGVFEMILYHKQANSSSNQAISHLQSSPPTTTLPLCINTSLKTATVVPIS